MLSIVGVTVRPLLLATQYKILCVKYAVFCCIIFQIVLQLKWFDPPLNSCKTCYTKTVYNSKRTLTRTRTQSNMSLTYPTAPPRPAPLWFLIWQSIDSSFGKHKQTLIEICTKKYQITWQKLFQSIFSFPHTHTHTLISLWTFTSHFPFPISTASTSSISVFQYFNARDQFKS